MNAKKQQDEQPLLKFSVTAASVVRVITASGSVAPIRR